MYTVQGISVKASEMLCRVGWKCWATRIPRLGRRQFPISIKGAVDQATPQKRCGPNCKKSEGLVPFLCAPWSFSSILWIWSVKSLFG